MSLQVGNICKLGAGLPTADNKKVGNICAKPLITMRALALEGGG